MISLYSSRSCESPLVSKSQEEHGNFRENFPGLGCTSLVCISKLLFVIQVYPQAGHVFNGLSMMLASMSAHFYIGSVAILANQIRNSVVIKPYVPQSRIQIFQFSVATVHPTYHPSLDILIMQAIMPAPVNLVLVLPPSREMWACSRWPKIRLLDKPGILLWILLWIRYIVQGLPSECYIYVTINVAINCRYTHKRCWLNIVEL